jgi:glycine/D-amino acid oxidase-like deaminating enzyme
MKDVCIIGGGIAGLYMAMRLRQHGIDNIVVIESEKKILGGRVRTARFAGQRVVLGAGIGRAAKDHTLKRLMDRLDPRKALYSPFQVQIQWAPTIQKKYPSPETIVVKKKGLHVPFGKLLREALGTPREYNNFMDASLYTNFEADDADDVIRDYGMDDNEGGWTGWRIDWKRLIDLLKERVGRNRLMMGRRVVGFKSLTSSSSSWIVETSSGGSIPCRVVVVATDIRTVRALLPDHVRSLYGGIRGQSFVRVYATFDPAGSKIMASAVKTLTIVPRPLKKIVPIDPQKGLYMIAYSDNADADRVRRVMHKKGVLSEMLQKALGLDQKLRILRLRSHYWPVGTHAYLPLSPKFSSRTEFIKKAQRPERGVYVVGELVSRQQGWTEGALRSVDSVFQEVAGASSWSD